MNAILSKEDLTSAREELQPLIFTKNGRMRSKCPYALFALYYFLQSSNEDKYVSIDAKANEYTCHRCSWENPPQQHPLAQIFIKNKAAAEWAPYEVLQGIEQDHVRHLISPISTLHDSKGLILPLPIAETLIQYWTEEYPLYKFTIKEL